ncbi:cbxX/CfqX [Artemisia annua]|uniref:CbxX/CfqX n=1 Tax=Artemisia annua TaxID=35608 RepID=A0A2U1Q0G3_ARTAN|nr:cbxX/CfqX [Artemisia annua]
MLVRQMCSLRPGHEKLRALLNSYLEEQRKRRAIEACSGTQAKMDELEKELSNLVGLNELKLQLRKWAKGMLLDERQRALGLKVGTRRPPHMAFLANPGTGNALEKLFSKPFSANTGYGSGVWGLWFSAHSSGGCGSAGLQKETLPWVKDRAGAYQRIEHHKHHFSRLLIMQIQETETESSKDFQVSFADVLIISATDATLLVRGPYCHVPVRRKYSRKGSFAQFETNAPGANDELKKPAKAKEPTLKKSKKKRDRRKGHQLLSFSTSYASATALVVYIFITNRSAGQSMVDGNVGHYAERHQKIVRVYADATSRGVG